MSFLSLAIYLYHEEETLRNQEKDTTNSKRE